MRKQKKPGIPRRDVLVAAAVAVAAPAVASGAGLVQTVTRKFFTAEEVALVDELSELIVPTDDHSPGARAAKVADYIDARLAEATDPLVRARWRTGLQAVEALSQSMHGKPFLEASPAERQALVTRIAANERSPKTDEEKFFVELKRRTVHAYYTSKIGIHQEMEYKGNTLLQDFVGIDVTGRG